MDELFDPDEPERVDQRRYDRRRVIGELRSDSQSAADAVGRAGHRSARRGASCARTTQIAFIYVRVSTREQARTGGGEEGYSIPAQRLACIEKAQQIGADVAEIYIDAGESAKTARRPQLQRMLRDVAELHPDYVIVHKIDRLARNRADDIAINMALRKVGTQLVSCSEAITDTPSGKFLYNIMADMAQFYSDNLAQEVKKGLTAKAAEGGTPFKAPLGYLHRRDYRDGIQVSWVEPDPERGPLVSWAFEQYATGEWTSKKLLTALQDKGLTTRKTAQRPERELTLTSLLNMLRNPYYMGVISYQGVTYEGRHQALVSTDVWLQVQDVLAAHAHAGDKDRVHTHYLRGTIFCGQCGKRLIFSRNVGRRGIAYDYFMCPKRHNDKVHCTQKAVRVERVEDGILRLYARIELPESTVRNIKLGVHAEMAAETAEAHHQAERANKQLDKLGRERTALMRAHYDGAVPTDVLKTEMDRLTRAMAAAQRQVEVTDQHLSDVEELFDQALGVASQCHRQYASAPDLVRKQINQGFFQKLWIDENGDVQRYAMTEPFKALLERRSGPVRVTKVEVVSPSTNQTDGQAGEHDLAGDDNTPTSDEGRGVNVTDMVELRGIEPLTFSMRTRRATNCATAPGLQAFRPCRRNLISRYSPAARG